MKKSFLSVTSAVIMLTLLLSGCSNNRKIVDKDGGVTPAVTAAPAVSPDDEGGEVTPSPRTDNDKKYNAKDMDDIEAALDDMGDVSEIQWSDDESIVAFTRGQGETRVFLWKVGEKEPSEVGKYAMASCFIWSPDSKYVIVDESTDISGGGSIISIEKGREIYDISYYGFPIWSPDSKWVAIGAVSDIKAPDFTDLTGTIDLAVFNPAAKETKVIEKGTGEYYFVPTDWDEDGTIFYTKSGFSEDGEGAEEELFYEFK
jgi:uncharacterized protein YceK